MKRFWSIVLILVLLLVPAFLACTYQVRQTESVLVTRFGDPVRSKTEPGLYLRWPVPIERVNRFDSRSRLLESVIEETSTKDQDPIIVMSYLVWRIDEPELFLTSVQDVQGAESTLRELLRNAQNSVIGQHSFNEFVNTDTEKIQFEIIEGEITAALRGHARSSYGIEVRSVGLKRLMVPEKTTEQVFERMRADRKGKADAILAAGNAEAEQIRSDANAKQKEILAIARSQADAIIGAGQAEAAGYYEQLKEDKELAMFLRDLDALKKILQDRTTLVLGTDVEPIQLLKELPKLEPAQAQ